MEFLEEKSIYCEFKIDIFTNKFFYINIFSTNVRHREKLTLVFVMTIEQHYVYTRAFEILKA